MATASATNNFTNNFSGSKSTSTGKTSNTTSNTFGGTAALPTQYSYNPTTGQSTPTGVVYGASAGSAAPAGTGAAPSYANSEPGYTLNANGLFVKNGATTPNAPINTTQPNPATVNATPYTIQKGDTLAKISASQGLSMADILKNNPGITDPNKIQAGSQLNLNGLTPAQQGFNNAKASGTEAPQGGSALANTKPLMPATTPDNTGIDNVLAQDKGYQQLLKDKQDYEAVSNESLVKTYQDLTSQAGIPQLNTQLMNLKNIIDGTEDDIRNEVTKAGGFATDSQILALSSARNKTLIQNYNNLLETRNQAQQQVNTMVGLAEKDQSMALQRINGKMQIDTQIMNYQDKMRTNAQNAYQKIVDAVGYQGLYKSTGGDPYYNSLIENTMGLQPGGLKQLALVPDYKQMTDKVNYLKASKELADLNAGSSTTTPTDLTSNSILAQTGLSLPAFYTLTGQSSNLPRDAVTRKAAFAEATKWANAHGIDTSTLASQYKAQNDVLEKNISRAASTKIFAGEVAGSADALMSAIDEKDLQKGWTDKLLGITSFKPTNLLSVAAGNQVNDKLTMKYSTQLASMVNDYAGYLAASRGANIPEKTDLETAANVISNGLNSGSTQAFKESIQLNEEKVAAVVDRAVNDARNSVWSLFGVTRPGENGQTTSPQLLQPQEIPAGYYQASDGLLYKKQ